jgi:hypothetical protein
MDPEQPPREGFPTQRPSASADAARRAELERIEAMTPMERVLEALALGDEWEELQSFVSIPSSDDARGVK